MLTVVERMDEEFVKILKECDAHSNEYVERLKDEKRVCVIIDSLQTYIERQKIDTELCRLYMRKIEHLYYKFEKLEPSVRTNHRSYEVYPSCDCNNLFWIDIYCDLIGLLRTPLKTWKDRPTLPLKA